ncbi:MAG: hypothetical protein IK123_08690 [Lachnospiraceae bacterium]|nr:hypothetical protein [Lachnospiraceae bacterium]
MGAAFALVYVFVFLFIIMKAVKVAKKNGGKGFISDPNYQSPAYKATMDAIAKGAAEAGAEIKQSFAGSLQNVDTVVSRPVNQSPAPASPVTTPVNSQTFSTPMKQPSVHANLLSKEPAVNRLMDDREHDWLARQLADERVAKRRMSAMFELKAEHEANCDAHANKLQHIANCDADGIDTARA